MNSDAAPPQYEQEIPDVLQGMATVQAAIEGKGISPTLRHLMLLRASQINSCAYCVKMHTAQARRDGETNERLDRLVVWRDVEDYEESERAALAWTEALTDLDSTSDLRPLRSALREHFSESEVAALSALIAMINLWNRIGISRH